MYNPLRFEYGGALSYDDYALQLVGVLTFHIGKALLWPVTFHCTASISDFPTSHSSQLTNPILGFNDGDPLSADDQSYVLDNVFNYHPDKAVKMGAGNNHVTIFHRSFCPKCMWVFFFNRPTNTISSCWVEATGWMGKLENFFHSFHIFLVKNNTRRKKRYWLSNCPYHIYNLHHHDMEEEKGLYSPRYKIGRCCTDLMGSQQGAVR
ncbi:RNA pol Rpb1 domain-containing protein [Salix suchowensis]|nr:RNA pol Rpb1 domain-containing protein [Salix suchowensis]